MEELRKLERLRELAPDLNRETDEAASVVQRVERYLAGLGLGIPVQVLVESEPYRSDEEVRGRHEVDLYLAYGRLPGSGYRVLVRRVHAVEQVAGVWDTLEVLGETAWSGAPRADKLKTFSKLPLLLDEIIREAEQLKAEAERARGVVSGFLDGLSKVEAEESPGETAPPLRASARRPATEGGAR